MTVNEKLEKLRKKMKERSLDAYYIPSADPHMSEYLPENYKTREFMSGFTGSAGTVIVLPDEAFLWTDGRYFIQAEKQLAGSSITLCKMGEKGVLSVLEFLETKFAKGGRLGVDGKVLSVAQFRAFKEKAPQLECVTDIDLVGELWEDRPSPVASKAFLLDTKFTGESTKEKIARLRSVMTKKEVSSVIACSLDEVCYLYNIRGFDVACNPVITSYAIVDKDRACLFVNKEQLSPEIMAELTKQDVTIFDYDAVFDEVSNLKGSVLVDTNSTNLFLFNKIKARVIEERNPILDMKARKNNTEVDNIRKAMLSDGIALVKFLNWLFKNLNTNISETGVVKKLHEFRSLDTSFIEDSFETIAGYGENAAIIHYKPIEGEDKILEPKGFLLLDSGGQYFTGTTDITRTIPLGPLSDDEKRDYTLVLKSHINLAKAVFKEGVSGFALDIIARQPLWVHGKDYNHGTGHGVGFVLGVHEGPQSISQRYNNVAFDEGMLTSNEPGLYIAGKYGIRIENLILTKKHLETEFGTFYEFETVTICPLSTVPVQKELLTEPEIAWLNEYNAYCYECLSPHLNDEEKEFLKKETVAI